MEFEFAYLLQQLPLLRAGLVVTIQVSAMAVVLSLAIGVLGALFMSGEYGTGMIRSSLATVPRRLPVLWGKLAVFTVVVGAVSLAMNAASFFLGEAVLGIRYLVGSDPAVGRLSR